MFGQRRAAFVFMHACVSTYALVGLVAPVRAQSLADVARKAREEAERRRAVSQPGKVYTNKDLRPAPSPAPPPAPVVEQKSDQKTAPEKDTDNSGTRAETTGKDTNAAADAKEPVRDQAYWSGRLKALQERLERDQTYADALQSRINALFTDFSNRDDPVQKGAIERDRLKAIAELDRLKQAIPNDKKAVENLFEEARRAGVPPGWLR